MRSIIVISILFTAIIIPVFAQVDQINFDYPEISEDLISQDRFGTRTLPVLVEISDIEWIITDSLPDITSYQVEQNIYFLPYNIYSTIKTANPRIQQVILPPGIEIELTNEVVSSNLRTETCNTIEGSSTLFIGGDADINDGSCGSITSSFVALGGDGWNDGWVGYGWSVNTNSSSIQTRSRYCTDENLGTLEISWYNHANSAYQLVSTRDNSDYTTGSVYVLTLSSSNPTNFISTGWFEMRYVSNDGWYIDWTEFCADCPEPSAPSIVSATDGDYCDRVDISWSGVTGATSYKILRDNTTLNNNVSGTSYSDYNGAAGQTYAYKVYANNNCGTSSNYDSDNGYKNSTSSNPTNVAATDGDFTDHVAITWNDNSNNESGFKIYRNSTLIITAQADVQSHNDYDAVPGTNYNYCVTSYNNCGESNQTCDLGFAQSNGTIGGLVSTPVPNPSGVNEVDITIVPISGVGTESYTTRTSENGTYSRSGIDYVTGTTYRVTPSKTNHSFHPTYRDITLNSSSSTNDQVDFTDISEFTVTGVIKYQNTDCYIEGVNIHLDGSPTSPNPTLTDASGEYDLTVNLGNHTITPVYSNHTFSPINYTNYIESPLSYISFDDTFTHSLSGKVVGGCDIILGEAVITLTSTTYCYSPDPITTNPFDGTFSIELPPLVYYVDVEIPSNPVIDFPTQTVDLTQGDIILDIIHHNPLEVEFSGFPDLQSSCQIPIMQQGESYEINISVFERYGDYNCPLDYGVLTIYDDISDINDPIEIIVENGSASYTIITGEPNILSGGLHPYEKQLEVEINNESVIHDQWVYVEGHKPRTETFTTVSPELPFFILRDPPGDESYSYLSNSTTSCIAVSMAFEAEGAVGIFINAKYGLEFSVGFAGISGNVGAGIEIDGSVEVGGGLNLQEETEVCISTQTVFSTSDQQEITGPEGDVYGGAAINLIYAITDVLEINDNCEVEINQNIAWNGDGFSTQYLYTDGHIRNVLIPQLNQTGQTDAAVLWQDILDLNDLLKQQAVFEINRSFVAGATTEYSESFTLTESRYIEYYTFIDADVAVQAGIEVFGTGVSGGVKVRGRFQIGDALYSDYSITNSVGYSLQDDDPGDYFSVDVKNDNVFGTPVFELVSGASSCPWEHPTTPREGVEIHIDPHDMSNISPDDLASFNLDLGNISQTNEEREYHLSVIQESNPYGAIINVGGVIIEDYLSYTIPSGQQIPATLSVGIGPSMYDYENLQVELFSPCDHEQIADTATFSVSYIPPCTDVTIISPENNWILNQNNNDTLQIIVSDYDLTDVNLLRLKLQFSNSGDNDWIDIESLEVADIIDNYQIIYWEVTHLSDGEYDIRAIVVCTNGENYSDVLTGIIDRNSPELFGLPQPSDGILEAGDEISSNFTETIDCNLVNSSNVSLITEDGLIISNFAVQCNGSSIIIVLQVDNYIIENKILTATLSGISDNNGNIITEDICWSFFVNRNPVYWSPPNITQLTNEGTGFSISAMLLNNGSQEESFLITNYADWITPTTTNGLIPVLGQSSVDFVISDQLGIGTHIDTLYADTDMGDEPLLIIINVYPVIPWNVNPSDYQYNMALTGIIQFDGVPSTDSLDLVAAFVNDECRGIASPHQFGDNGDYPFGMTIFSNQVTGEIIHFKAYDYSENLMYHNIEETFGFTSDAVLGNLSSPEILNAISSYALEIPMTGNWNWFSFNVVLDDMSTNNILASIGDNGLFIKNQSSFAEYYPGNGWISLNGLNVLENTSGYKIKMANPDTLIITGIPLDVFNTPIYLDSNWNWIGYLPQNAIEINEALVSIENNGLFIKDQSSFAEYYTGNGWISLNGLGILEPGNGYMLKMGSDDTLWYQPGNDDVRLAQVKQLNAQYNHEPGNYADNMCVTSEMRIQGIDCIDTNFILLAYSNDECRGVSKLTYVPVLDRYLFGLTISGNNQDQLTFKVMNSVNDEWYDIDYNLEFISNKVIGSCLNPLILLISPLGIDNQPAVPEKFTVSQNFPNPFNSVTKIDFGLSSNGQTKITIYNVVGQEIKTLINRELKPGWHSVSWMGHDNSGNSVPSGIYIYRVESGISNDTKKMILIK